MIINDPFRNFATIFKTRKSGPNFIELPNGKQIFVLHQKKSFKLISQVSKRNRRLARLGEFYGKQGYENEIHRVSTKSGIKQ